MRWPPKSHREKQALRPLALSTQGISNLDLPCLCFNNSLWICPSWLFIKLCKIYFICIIYILYTLPFQQSLSTHTLSERTDTELQNQSKWAGGIWVKGKGLSKQPVQVSRSFGWHLYWNAHQNAHSNEELTPFGCQPPLAPFCWPSWSQSTSRVGLLIFSTVP